MSADSIAAGKLAGKAFHQNFSKKSTGHTAQFNEREAASMNTAIIGALVAQPSVFFGKFIFEALPGAAIAYGLVWLAMRPKDGRRVMRPFLYQSVGVAATVTGSAMFRIIAMATFAGHGAYEPAAETGAAGFYILLVPAIVAAGYIAWLKSQLSTPPKPAVIASQGNDAYAGALAEIQEGQLEKGVWARSFADSGGDELKAKALYIKARAESIKDAAVWVNTRPPSEENAGIKVTDEGQTARISPVPVTKSLTTSTFEIGVWVIFVLAFFGWWQYSEHTKWQAATANPVQAPAPQLDLSEFQKAPNSQTGTDWDKGVITPPGAPSQSPESKTNLEPFLGKLDTANAQKPLVKPQVTVIRESAPRVGFSAEVQADLNAIAARAVNDYPYLDTPAGQEVLDKIFKKRNDLIREGVYPSIALTQAINAYAAANAPRANKVKESEPAPVEGNHSGFPPECRWVTPQEWSCK